MTTEITTLANGLRVVSERRPELETAAVGLWVDAGSRHETLAQNGLSHMLEHMAFKGTERRSARDIAEAIEAVGGYLNAYTSREQTAYYARVLKGDVPLAVDLLADILQHSVFDEGELEREREVIVQEIGQTLDTPDDVVFDYLQATSFPDQALGRSILGTVASVRGFRADMLRGYMSAHYHAPSMVLSAAGAVDHGRLVALAEQHFSALSPATPRQMERGHFEGGDFRLEKPLEQAHLTLALPGVTYADPDYYVCQVLVNALGGGMSSRLFQEVREKRGLCYSIYAFASAYADAGLVGIYVGTGSESVGALVPVITGEIEALARSCTADETARSRAQLKAGLLMSLESCSARCEQLARHLLVYGRVVPTAEMIARIEAIGVADVSRYAETLLKAGRPSVAAIGPITALESYGSIAARFG